MSSHPLREALSALGARVPLPASLWLLLTVLCSTLTGVLAGGRLRACRRALGEGGE